MNTPQHQMKIDILRCELTPPPEKNYPPFRGREGKGKFVVEQLDDQLVFSYTESARDLGQVRFICTVEHGDVWFSIGFIDTYNDKYDFAIADASEQLRPTLRREFAPYTNQAITSELMQQLQRSFRWVASHVCDVVVDYVRGGRKENDQAGVC